MGLDETRRLQLSKHADLKTRAEGDVLVLPERAMRIGGSGGEILRLVIEGGSVGSILETMRDRYPDAADLDSEVGGYLEEMLENGALVQLDVDEEPGSAS